MLNIILLPILLPVWAMQLLFWGAFFPVILVMKICGADVGLLPPFVTLGGNGISRKTKPLPPRPETSAEFARRIGFGRHK